MTEPVKKKETNCKRYNKFFDMLKERGKGEINKSDVLRLLYRECLITEAVEDKGFVKMAEELADMHRQTNTFRKKQYDDAQIIQRLRDDNNRLKDITWTQADEIDKLAAENYRLANNISALQNRLYLNKLPYNLPEEAEQ